MVNEERVKNLFKIALYEQSEETYERQTGLYHKGDYIGKELIKSFFIGTAAYGLMIVLWAISSMEACFESVNNLEIIRNTVIMIVLYIGFMAIYLFATYLVARSRYKQGRTRLKEYVATLKTTKKMYEREEKLKM